MNNQSHNSHKDHDVASQLNKPAFWFWIIAIAALFWYIMDSMAFAMRISINEASLANMPDHQQQFMKNIPAWVNVVFAFEVFGGLLGSIALLLRRRMAQVLYVLSLGGVLCQTFYIWFVSDHVKLMGAMAIVMPSVAMVISLAMIFVSQQAIKRGWLR